jgi:serine/threonine protein kinase
MVTSELGACEWFVWDLRRSGLIERGPLDQVVGEFLTRSPRAEPPQLAEFLVSQAVLTAFQAERILQGKTQGLVLGPYVLVDAIGAGSMGQVYKAQSKTDNQWYAVKVLPRRSMWNVRLARRQVRAFSQFTHQAVVPFVDVGTAGGQHYLVWPLVEGETLEARVTREGRLPTDVAGVLMSQVAQGLAAAHGHGLFHGLLKPSNILIGPDGQARLLDFGIGSLLAENEGDSLVDTMSTANTLTSGLDCTSPESIMEPTNRTQAGDQYSFGCILYFCLAGRYPFPDGTAVEKMMAHQFKQPTPLHEAAPGIPEGLSAIVDRLMQKSPDGRYAGVDEVVEALTPFAPESGRRGASGGHYGGHRTAPPAPPAAPITVPGSSRFDSGPLPPSRFDSGPAPVAASRFDSIPGSRPGAPPAPAARSMTVSSTYTPPPAPAPSAPKPAASQFGASRFGADVPRPAPPQPTPATPPAPPPPTRSSLARSLPQQAPPRPLPVAQRLPPLEDDSDIPEALPVDDEPAPRARLPRAGRSFVGDADDAPRAGRISVFLVFLVTALVTTGVYILGKSFIFE